MAASNSSVFATHAVTHRYSCASENGATSCSHLAPEHLKSSQAKAATHDSVCQSDSDLSCVGGWTDKALYHNTVSLPAEVDSDATQPGCMRHRSVHEACLDSTDHTRVVELLSSSDTTSLTSVLLESEKSGSPVLVCTCKSGLQLEIEESAGAAPMKSDTIQSSGVPNTT